LTVRRARRPHCDILGAVLLLLLLGAAVARAQDIGTLAALEGTVQLGRGGTWIPATIGTGIMVGDELRTGAGRVRVVFQDGSVLTAADNTQIRIDEQVFDPNRAVSRSLIRLVQGKIRALVSEYYERPRSFFQIETVTAVSGVRGTEFVIAFDPVAEVTEVVGVSGRAEVHSVLDPIGHGVMVRAKELTSVKRGKFPTPPRRIADELFRQYLDKLEFVGGGKAESLTIAIPLATGNVVPEPDRAASVPGAPAFVVSEEPAGPGGAEPKLTTSAPVLADDIIQHSQGASGLLGNSPPVIESTTGKLGIRF